MRRALLSWWVLALPACKGAAPTAAPEAAPPAMAEGEGDDEVMLERVAGEDTRWVDLPHFGQCPYGADDIPPYTPVDDADVPAVADDRTRASNEDSGDEALSDRELLVHLDRATAEVLTCVSVSACYDPDPPEQGEIDFAFEVTPRGHVRGVNVQTSAELDEWGIRECARRAIFDTTFPAFDGSDMVVSYRLELDGP